MARSAPQRPRARAADASSARDGATPAAETTAAAALLDALRALDREMRVAPALADVRGSLPPAQARTLRTLAERPALSLAELAERTHTDPSSVSVVVQRLVEQGLVSRTPAAADRRRTELAITAAGIARLRREPTSAEHRLAEAIETLGERRASSVARGLRALAKALQPTPAARVATD
jgi:MarR family transcriptional regulator, organic hydroperoxide resistance regulator